MIRIAISSSEKLYMNLMLLPLSQYFETFDVLINFPFSTSETMRDYYLQTWYIRVALRVTERLKT